MKLHVKRYAMNNTSQNQSQTIDIEYALIKKAKNGDHDAFARLTEAYSQRIYNIGLRMLKSPEDAADMTQETLLKIYRHLPEFRGEASFSTWVYRVAVNTCKDMLRSACRRREIIFSDFSQEENDAMFEVADYSALPEQIYETKESSAYLRHLIDGLSPAFRVVMLLREIGGLSYQEIAAAVNISEGTVKSRINRARGAMKKEAERLGTLSDNASSVGARG